MENIMSRSNGLARFSISSRGLHRDIVSGFAGLSTIRADAGEGDRHPESDGGECGEYCGDAFEEFPVVDRRCHCNCHAGVVVVDAELVGELCVSMSVQWWVIGLAAGAAVLIAFLRSVSIGSGGVGESGEEPSLGMSLRLR